MRILITLLWAVAVLSIAQAQTQFSTISPAGLVEMGKTSGLEFQSKTLFTLNPEGRNRTEITQAGISTYDHLQLQEEELQALLAESPESFKMQIPSLNRQQMEVELVKVDILAEGFRVIESDGNRPVLSEMGVHYRGVVKGIDKSVVAISVFENEVMGLFSLPHQGNIVLGKLTDDEQAPTDQYILYNDQEVHQNNAFECGTPDDGPGYTREQLMDMAGGGRDVGDCIQIYFEVDNDIYRDKGSSSQVTNYVTGLFNEVATLYANENVNITISEIFIWTSTSPYSGSSSSAMLSQFQNIRRSFNGDLGQLLSYQASGGIAVLNGLCHPYTAARLSFSSINKTYRSLPNYSFSVMVVAHELGHLLGSHHTHACKWNGNNTAIDGCAGFTEGSCGNPGIPSNGGTVMSYCHISSTGINFSKGFGPQPGNVIRNIIANARCTSACDGDNGGGDNGGGDNGGGDNGGGDNGGGDNGGGDNGGGDNGGGDNGGGDNGGGDNGGGDNGGGDNGGGDNGGGDNGGGDNGGGDNGGNQNCTETKMYLDLTLDNFGMETTWEVLDANGDAVASGGPYPKKMAGEVMRDSFCLAEACYTFKIMDSDGDGICCAYGQGGYYVIDEAGNVYADGGTFESEDLADFCVGEPQDDNNDGCLGINFNDYVVESYGSFQDVGDAEVMNNGTTLKIENNAWKAININYNVTAGTVLQFEFGSSIEGEIHGIGLDDNNTISFSKTFQLYGTQRWGIQNFNDYDGASTWKTYRIPLGDYYRGLYKYLVFMADHDSGFSNSNSFFRNVVLFERDNNECYSGLEEQGTTTSALPVEALSLYPNPAQEVVHVNFPITDGSTSLIRIFDATGQVVEERSVTATERGHRESLSINHLSQGTYFIQVTQGEQQWSSKFNISRH